MVKEIKWRALIVLLLALLAQVALSIEVKNFVQLEKAVKNLKDYTPTEIVLKGNMNCEDTLVVKPKKIVSFSCGNPDGCKLNGRFNLEVREGATVTEITGIHFNKLENFWYKKYQHPIIKNEGTIAIIQDVKVSDFHRDIQSKITSKNSDIEAMFLINYGVVDLILDCDFSNTESNLHYYIRDLEYGFTKHFKDITVKDIRMYTAFYGMDGHYPRDTPLVETKMQEWNGIVFEQTDYSLDLESDYLIYMELDYELHVDWIMKDSRFSNLQTSSDVESLILIKGEAKSRFTLTNVKFENISETKYGSVNIECDSEAIIIKDCQFDNMKFANSAYGVLIDPNQVDEVLIERSSFTNLGQGEEFWEENYDILGTSQTSAIVFDTNSNGKIVVQDNEFLDVHSYEAAVSLVDCNLNQVSFDRNKFANPSGASRCYGNACYGLIGFEKNGIQQCNIRNNSFDNLQFEDTKDDTLQGLFFIKPQGNEKIDISGNIFESCKMNDFFTFQFDEDEKEVQVSIENNTFKRAEFSESIVSWQQNNKKSTSKPFFTDKIRFRQNLVSFSTLSSCLTHEDVINDYLDTQKTVLNLSGLESANDAEIKDNTFYYEKMVGEGANAIVRSNGLINAQDLKENNEFKCVPSPKSGEDSEKEPTDEDKEEPEKEPTDEDKEEPEKEPTDEDQEEPEKEPTDEDNNKPTTTEAPTISEKPEKVPEGTEPPTEATKEESKKDEPKKEEPESGDVETAPNTLSPTSEVEADQSLSQKISGLAITVIVVILILFITILVCTLWKVESQRQTRRERDPVQRDFYHKFNTA